LQSGVANQQGWSVGADAKLLGTRLFAEYAQLTKDVNDNTPVNGDTSYVVGADLLNNWNGLSLTGKYGMIGRNYRPYLSSLYPYAAVNAYDINWIDRPLFLDPNNVTQGWEGDLRWAFGCDWLMNFRIYGGKHSESNLATTNANQVWTVSLKKQIATNVAASVLYGQNSLRNFNGGAQLENLKEGNDLKVIRGAIEFTL